MSEKVCSLTCVDDIGSYDSQKLSIEAAERLWMEQSFAAVAKSGKFKKRRKKVPKSVPDRGNVSKATRQPVDKGEASKSLKNAQEQPSIAVDKISRVDEGVTISRLKNVQTSSKLTF